MVVGVVCQEPLFREALESLLRTQNWLEVMLAQSNVRATLSLFAKQTPDMILLVDEGLEEEDWSMYSALRTLTGVKGILIKKLGAPSSRLESMVDGIHRREEGAAELFRVMRRTGLRSLRHELIVAETGNRYGQRKHLTQRESEVAGLVAQGLPNRRIAVIMGLQEQSVKNLVSIVMRKLGCENRVQVALRLSGGLQSSASPSMKAEE